MFFIVKWRKEKDVVWNGGRNTYVVWPVIRSGRADRSGQTYVGKRPTVRHNLQFDQVINMYWRINPVVSPRRGWRMRIALSMRWISNHTSWSVCCVPSDPATPPLFCPFPTPASPTISSLWYLSAPEVARARFNIGIYQNYLPPLVLINKWKLTHWLITTSQKPLKWMQWKLVHNFHEGHRHSLRKDYEKIDRVRDHDPLNTHSCIVLQYSL